MSEEICQKCKEPGHDRRTLWMACFYEMSELGLPLEQVHIADRIFYTLRVCKDCRASWMGSIKDWFNEVIPTQTSYGTDIYIRELGATKEISEEESHKKNPGREPVRYKE